MSVAGDDQILVLYTKQAGAAVTYATKAAFQAAGFDLTWYDTDGVALSSQPTWSLPVAGASGRHQFKFVEPLDPYTIKVTVPAGYTSVPIEATGEGDVYDIDSVGASIATSASTILSATATSNTATMFDGDSIYLTFDVADAALTAIGASSLANCDTLAAEIKLDTADSSAAAAVTTLAEAIVTDTAGAYVVRGTLDAFPAALAVPAGQKSLACTAHLRLTKGTKTIIGSEIRLTINWKATT